ncbi:MAG: molybdenum cofactor guanylyltransferase MobA [Hyphomicrobiaceae bacterium]
MAARVAIEFREVIAGVLLAGGQSRRMFAHGGGGAAEGATGDKGLLELDGRPMLSHVIERLGPQVGALALNANGDPARFAPFGLPVIADTVAGYAGPLAGVLSGLRWAARDCSSTRYVLTASTDAPFLPGDLAERLMSALEAEPALGGRRIALARSQGHLHPVIGLWPVDLAADLEQALGSGVRKVLAWTDRHGTLGVDFPPVRFGGTEVDPFFNANTPAELDEARRLLELVASA